MEGIEQWGPTSIIALVTALGAILTTILLKVKSDVKEVHTMTNNTLTVLQGKLEKSEKQKTELEKIREEDKRRIFELEIAVAKLELRVGKSKPDRIEEPLGD